MIGWLRQRRRRRLLEGWRTEAPLWFDEMARLPLLEGLNDGERERLWQLARLFLHEKSLELARGAALDERQRRLLALQAALPILHLGLDHYRDWVSVVIYPAEFVSEFDAVDEDGVAHRIRRPLTGESWDRGPVILAAAEIEEGLRRDGVNVVIHEMIHKLDALEGGIANGRPPLPQTIAPREWSETLAAAYDDHCRRLDGGEEYWLDPYAAEAPEEFLAVTGELFFELPHWLRDAYPEVYDLYTRLYRQDPAARLTDVDPA
ncbi:M90 family metallopeptidase [Endothiovibrio diazotrophicus]